QLRDELVRRIPVYAPEWTDHNPSDPGITLLELFAFLGENLLFRFNQIPEATKLAFLRLLQIPLRPATPSRALIAVSKATEPKGVLVEQRSVANAGAVSFETITEVVALPIESVAAAKIDGPPPAPDTEEAKFADGAVLSAQLGAGEQPAFYDTRILPDDPS